MGLAGLAGAKAVALAVSPPTVAESASSVFHSPQPPQRPAHLSDTSPQARQRNRERDLDVIAAVVIDADGSDGV